MARRAVGVGLEWFWAYGGDGMAHDELLKRITSRPDIFAGKPIIRGMRDAIGSQAGGARGQLPSSGGAVQVIAAGP